jgi:hypothetical protein
MTSQRGRWRSTQAVLAYGAKLRLVEKWAAVDASVGLDIATRVAEAGLVVSDL